MTTRHRCPGGCGRGLPIEMDVCRACGLLPDPARFGIEPTPCTSCGVAVAPGRTASGMIACSYCDEKERAR